MTPDLINCLFNLGGVAALSLSIIKLLKDKQVFGISWPTMFFFMSWSTWNLYFYIHLHQWVSLIGGAAILSAELVYVSLLMYYSYEMRKHA